MSNREHTLFLNLRSQKDGIVSLDNNRFIAGYAGNINPAAFSKSATTISCIALKHQSSMESPFKAHGCFYEDDKGTVFSVSSFISLNELPDDPRLRAVIVQEIRALFPDVRILEELN
jgi:hypothetical protein